MARVLEVERDAALVAVDHLEGRRGAADEGRAPAARVVALRPLDLDDIGAEGGEHLAGEGAGEVLRDLDDLDAGERAAGRWRSSPSPAEQRAVVGAERRGGGALRGGA
jgi:hypothetical protein